MTTLPLAPERIRILDCTTSFGHERPFGPDHSLPALLALIERNGIAGAIATSLASLTYNDAEGNAFALAASRREPRVLPGVVAMPGRLYDGGTALRAALNVGGVLLKLYPEEHGWAPRTRAFADLVAVAAAPRPPV